jgi:hypothetical protein
LHLFDEGTALVDRSRIAQYLLWRSAARPLIRSGSEPRVQREWDSDSNDWAATSMCDGSRGRRGWKDRGGGRVASASKDVRDEELCRERACDGDGLLSEDRASAAERDAP